MQDTSYRFAMPMKVQASNGYSSLSMAILLSLLILSVGCTTVDTRLVNPEHAEHPAYKAFVAYSRTVSANEEFNAEVIDHFLPSLHETIEGSMGWYRLAFSASHQALRHGSCEEVYLQAVTPGSVLLNCKGPFEFVSHFGFKSQETMHLRTYIQKEGERWYIGRSGLFHTMGAGKSVPRSIGLKFEP